MSWQSFSELNAAVQNKWRQKFLSCQQMEAIAMTNDEQ